MWNGSVLNSGVTCFISITKIRSRKITTPLSGILDTLKLNVFFFSEMKLCAVLTGWRKKFFTYIPSEIFSFSFLKEHHLPLHLHQTKIQKIYNKILKHWYFWGICIYQCISILNKMWIFSNFSIKSCFFKSIVSIFTWKSPPSAILEIY